MFDMLFGIIVIWSIYTAHSISSANVGIRKNAIDLTSFEKEQLLDGFYKLKSTPSIYNSNYSAYDYFVAVHIVSNNPFTTYGHAQWSFLPWHRTFLYLFEQEMQRVLNNDSVRLPYWNVANDSETEILLNDLTFLGGNGSNEFPYLLPNNSMLSCDKFAVNHNLNGRKYNYTCLSRSIGVGRIIDDGILIASTLPEPSEWNDLIDTYRPYDVSPWNTAFDNFTIEHHLSSFRSLLDGCTKWIDSEVSIFLTNAVKNGACPYTMHGNGHVYIGGQLASGASPNDPLFFLLHAFVDLVWAQYQDKYGDESFPAQFMDIKLFKDDEFVCHTQWTANDVMDHRAQLDYMYDIQTSQTSVDSGESAESNQFLESPLVYICIGIGALLICLLSIVVIMCCCFFHKKSKAESNSKPNSRDYKDVEHEQDMFDI